MAACSEELLCGDYFAVDLAIFHFYSYGANASEKIARDEKDYRKWSNPQSQHFKNSKKGCLLEYFQRGEKTEDILKFVHKKCNNSQYEFYPQWKLDRNLQDFQGQLR